MECGPSFLWGKFNQLRIKIRSWQSAKYDSVVARSKECESELAVLLQSSVPQDSEKLEGLVMKKRELSLELRHLRNVEDQCWHQKSRVRSPQSKCYHSGCGSLSDNVDHVTFKSALFEVSKTAFNCLRERIC